MSRLSRVACHPAKRGLSLYRPRFALVTVVDRFFGDILWSFPKSDRQDAFSAPDALSCRGRNGDRTGPFGCKAGHLIGRPVSTP